MDYKKEYESLLEKYQQVAAALAEKKEPAAYNVYADPKPGEAERFFEGCAVLIPIRNIQVPVVRVWDAYELMQKQTAALREELDACKKELAEVREKYEPKPKEEQPQFECYEIHVVQARMYGCKEQCEECKSEQQLKTNS